MINAPSLANSNLLALGQDATALAEGGVGWFHVDVMDGHYVPNLCFPIRLVEDLKAAHPGVGVDAHLMVTDPAPYIGQLAQAGADIVSFPSDSTRFVRRLLATCRDAGMLAGVAINPSQRVEVIEPYLAELDIVVLMSVEPGFAGQRFLPRSLERLSALSALREAGGAEFLIEVDGGVDHDLGVECVDRGADVIVTGIWAVFQQDDPLEAAVDRFDSFVRAEADPQQYQRSLDRQAAVWARRER